MALLLRSPLLKSSLLLKYRSRSTDKEVKTVGTHMNIKTLWNLWQQGKVTAEQIVGQILQYLVAWHKEFEDLKLEVRKLKRQVEKVNSE